MLQARVGFGVARCGVEQIKIGAAIEKKVKAVQLRADGLSVRAIAEALGVSVGSVSGYLKTDPVECSKSLRITNGVAS